MRYGLRIAEAVWLQADAIDSWWRLNRRSVPRLFRDELEAAFVRLEASPFAAPLYGAEGQASGLRRLILPRSRYSRLTSCTSVSVLTVRRERAATAGSEAEISAGSDGS